MKKCNSLSGLPANDFFRDYFINNIDPLFSRLIKYIVVFPIVQGLLWRPANQTKHSAWISIHFLRSWRVTLIRKYQFFHLDYITSHWVQTLVAGKIPPLFPAFPYQVNITKRKYYRQLKFHLTWRKRSYFSNCHSGWG